MAGHSAYSKHSGYPHTPGHRGLAFPRFRSPSSFIDKKKRKSDLAGAGSREMGHSTTADDKARTVSASGGNGVDGSRRNRKAIYPPGYQNSDDEYEDWSSSSDGEDEKEDPVAWKRYWGNEREADVYELETYLDDPYCGDALPRDDVPASEDLVDEPLVGTEVPGSSSESTGGERVPVSKSLAESGSEVAEHSQMESASSNVPAEKVNQEKPGLLGWLLDASVAALVRSFSPQ